jgi:ATP-dependent Clp protease ATP-binding subunit ClpA
VIDEHIKRRLVDDILFGKLVNGGRVTVSVDGGSTDLKIECSSLEEMQKRLGGRKAPPQALPGKSEKV